MLPCVIYGPPVLAVWSCHPPDGPGDRPACTDFGARLSRPTGSSGIFPISPNLPPSLSTHSLSVCVRGEISMA